MGFNPTIRTERTVIGEDRTWCATRLGWDQARSITLDVSTFTEAANLDGYVLPSGLVLAKITASGLYGPYDPDGAGGQETAAGFLFSAVQLDNTAVASASDVGAALLWMGVIVEANLPSVGSAEGMLDAAAKTDLASFFRFE